MSEKISLDSSELNFLETKVEKEADIQAQNSSL